MALKGRIPPSPWRSPNGLVIPPVRPNSAVQPDARHHISFEGPRNATGKIEKPALRKKYGAEHLVAQQNLA